METVDLEMLPNDSMSPLFKATAEATEEAIVNAMVAAETITETQCTLSRMIGFGRPSGSTTDWCRSSETSA